MGDVFVVDGVRTPFGRFGGAMSRTRPDDMSARVLRALVDRHPGIAEHVDDVFMGNANGAGEENRNVARMAVLLSGLPVNTPGATVNRLCGSSLEAVIQAYRAVAIGDADVIIAGGVESMTRAPWVLQKPDRAFPHTQPTLHSTTIGWRMVNDRMSDRWTLAMGEGAEILAERHGITREAQDEFALRSHALAAAAWSDGVLAAEIVPGPEDLDRDESIRLDANQVAMAGLKPAFRDGGTVTAGNSSPINDGASAVLVASRRAMDLYGLTPLAKIVANGVTALEPELFGLGPVESTQKALAKVGGDFSDVDVLEINEAFAAQTLACLSQMPGLRPDVVNPHGGAIAMGHPLGASGTRLVGTLARELSRRGGGVGVATACIGVGQGLAVVLEA